MDNLFDEYESNVRSYCRSFPDLFTKAKGALLYSESNKKYIDFFAGAGALNYGHNDDYIKSKLIEYIESDGIAHGLDMYTVAKKNFIEMFVDKILKPRGLNYKIQFCGPTGTNAVEAAIKLARKVKQRHGIFSFMGGFHGMTQGSLALTGNLASRAGAGVPLNDVTFMPYPYEFGTTFDTIAYMDYILQDTHSGIEKPAAIIVETLQCEGGVVVAPTEWLIRLRELCTRHDILLICDEIQVGCGRTGDFFSFERADIKPDIVLLSKSISGYGLPMSILLMNPELDIWQPGEHNGTFRGNQLAFITATAALELMIDRNLLAETKTKEAYLKQFLSAEISSISSNIKTRGLGMVWGIDFKECGGAEAVSKIAAQCFEAGLIIEKSGRNDEVLKIMPPLTISMGLLKEGCSIIAKSIKNALPLD